MKKKLLLIALSALICAVFSACSSDDGFVYSDDYDSSKYARSSDIKGVSFLMPKDLYDVREPAANQSKYEDKEKANHVFQISDDANYNLYKPGQFFLYVFDLGKISGIEKQQTVSEIGKVIGTSSWLNFEDRNPKSYKSSTVNGRTQAVYGAFITESLTGSKITYSGYVTILHDADKDHAYCLVVGYGDYDNDATAKQIAKNFLFAE